MASPATGSLNPSDQQHEPLLHRLKQAAIAHTRQSKRERLLIQLLLGEADRSAKSGDESPSGDPPNEFREVLRRPKGGLHHLTVKIGDQEYGLVLNSRGDVNPEREEYLWRWLLRRAERGRG